MLILSTPLPTYIDRAYRTTRSMGHNVKIVNLVTGMHRSVVNLARAILPNDIWSNGKRLVSCK